MIGHISVIQWCCCLSVCLSVCLCMTDCIVALRVGVGVWKLHHRVPRRTLPIHFFRHFCYVMFRSATTQSEIRTAEISPSVIAMGSVITRLRLFQTRHLWRFGSAAMPCVVRSTIGLLSDSCASYCSELYSCLRRHLAQSGVLRALSLKPVLRWGREMPPQIQTQWLTPYSKAGKICTVLKCRHRRFYIKFPLFGVCPLSRYRRNL